MSILTADITAQLIADYATTPNTALARRYGITVGAVERLASTHGLHKDPDYTADRRSGAQLLHSAPAHFPVVRIPVYPAADYCTACGLSFSHLPGCTSRKRSTSPTWRRATP